MTELVYALVQAAHNLGAVAVVASPALALGLRGPTSSGGGIERRLAWTLLAAWALQAASGAGFAAASYGLKGQLPEVTGVALVALVVKLTATVGGLGVAIGLLRVRRPAGAPPTAWAAGLGLALAALLAAAPRRWYL
jgi:hypothetical protein